MSSPPSLPSISPRRTGKRQESGSYNPYDSPSAYGGRSARPTSRSMSNAAPPSPRGASTSSNQGFAGFTSGGMKSVWGKLSTNASAAFSAVQDAYDGVAREFKGLSVGGSPNSEYGSQGGEMHARSLGELNARDELSN